MTTKEEKATNPNLPWVEKYRPKQLDDLISHTDIISTIGKFVKEERLPHLLFYGPPGTGKTSTILAVAKQIYSPKEFNSMVLELNASDDRGIGIVRGQILSFASTRTIFKSGFKIVILDEADAMTRDAQNALRRATGKMLPDLIWTIRTDQMVLTSKCNREDISELKTKKGLALQDILTEIHNYVHRIDLPIHVKIHLLEKMADVEYRLASGTSEKMQLSSLISAFQAARDLIVAEA
ncbi:replication factor C subunit 3/5 [Mytilus galloprovincialis]|uniref:Replication factor C subunit 3/5 n=1 Tax=Mytilus galloprovincialis TaxID=29158 RepID=A0A8B6FGW8_MYTGA|nr:replication factor C subunit 3/5 [Mytilus galloprovincialis]